MAGLADAERPDYGGMAGVFVLQATLEATAMVWPVVMG